MMLKRLAQSLAEKRGMHISVVAGWLRCRLSFEILRSALICLHGSRPFRPTKYKADDVIDLAVNHVELTTDSLLGTELEKGVHLLPLVGADAHQMGYPVDVFDIRRRE